MTDEPKELRITDTVLAEAISGVLFLHDITIFERGAITNEILDKVMSTQST